jgi:hypothetical protein
MQPARRPGPACTGPSFSGLDYARHALSPRLVPALRDLVAAGSRRDEKFRRGP